jgi:hypothetical protein
LAPTDQIRPGIDANRIATIDQEKKQSMASKQAGAHPVGTEGPDQTRDYLLFALPQSNRKQSIASIVVASRAGAHPVGTKGPDQTRD